MSFPLGRPWEWLRRRLGFALDRQRLDAELREEIESHIAMRRDELVASGLDQETAEREARVRFGSTSLAREDSREAWGFPWLESIGRDVSHGVRVLRRSPLVTLAAVTSLAIAIGGAVAVFSIVDALLLRPLPVRDPESLVVLRWRSGTQSPFGSLAGSGAQDARGMSSTSFSEAAYGDMQAAAAGRAELFGFADLYRINAGVAGVVEPVSAQVVSGNYARVLGLVPALGRLLDARDDRADAAPVVVLSHAFWLRRFGGDASVLGRSIVVNGVSHTIVGVAPRGFHGTLQVEDRPELTFPLVHYASLTGADGVDRGTFWYVLLMARLSPGQAAGTLRPTLEAALGRATTESKPDLRAADLPRLELLPGDRGQLESRERTREPLALMGAIVALLMLVACANVASLQLARGEARNHEIVTRLAIGASRRRIVRQLLTEGLLLSAMAGALGILLARIVGSALLPALTGNEGFRVDLPLDGRMLLFALLTTVVCAVAFALAPALRLTRGARLPGAERSAGRSTRRQPLAASLVVTQVAFTLVLVAMAAWLVASLRNLEAVSPGFDTSRLMLVDLEPSGPDDRADRVQRYVSIIGGITALPGVESATLTDHRLLSGSSSITVSTPEGVAPPPPGSAEASAFERDHLTWSLTVGDEFFRTFGLPLVRGRGLDPRDGPEAPRVAVVNRRLARMLFDDEDVVGRRLVQGEDAIPFEIVGVAGDARYTSLRREAPPTIYTSFRQGPPGRVTIAIKTSGNPLASAAEVQSAVRRIDPGMVPSSIGTQEQQARDSMRQERVFARLAAVLGLATLLLCAIGLFGLLGYSVARRTREIGVRIAVGALPAEVAWMVVKQSLRLVALGVAIGLPAAIAGRRLVESMLFGVAPGDARMLALATSVMVVVGLLAALLPARRAARVDPLVALRVD